MILEGNYDPISIETLKKNISRVFMAKYGANNPRVMNTIKNLDIYFYTDEDSICECVIKKFNKDKPRVVRDIMKEVFSRREKFANKYMVLTTLLGITEKEEDGILGDQSNINIVKNMILVGPKVYLQGFSEKKRARIEGIYNNVMSTLNLKGKPITLQYFELNAIQQSIRKITKKYINRYGDVGKDYINIKKEYEEKRRTYLEHLDRIVGLSDRDKYILSKVETVDDNILSILDATGIFYGFDVSAPGDIMACTLEADIKLGEGLFVDSIYSKRVRIIEYINGLKKHKLKDGETWKDVYEDYKKKGYKNISMEEVESIEEYREMLSQGIIEETTQVSHILDSLSSNYVLPEGIDRQMFIEEDSCYIPNVIYTPDKKVEDKGVIILNDNIHVSRDLSLKNALHEADHGMITKLREDSQYGVVADVAMFGTFLTYGDREAVDERGNIIRDYTEPVNLIENINERKSKELMDIYDREDMSNPFIDPGREAYNYYNKYSIANIITDKFYDRFGALMDIDIARGSTILKDTVGIKNIMAIERLIVEFQSSRLKRDIISQVMDVREFKDSIDTLTPEIRSIYDDYMQRVDDIMRDIDLHIKESSTKVSDSM